MMGDKRGMLCFKISMEKKEDIKSKFFAEFFVLTTFQKPRNADYFNWEMPHAVSSE